MLCYALDTFRSDRHDRLWPAKEAKVEEEGLSCGEKRKGLREGLSCGDTQGWAEGCRVVKKKKGVVRRDYRHIFSLGFIARGEEGDWNFGQKF
jgi:hypothetical protein